jgi:hypothetical protein
MASDNEKQAARKCATHDWTIADNRHHVCTKCGRRILSSTLSAIAKAQQTKRVLDAIRRKLGELYAL